MASTQHFDALLIGALYGELSLTQRAELDAHLLAHPADAATFDQLTALRHTLSAYVAQVSMIEPPQSISAILLQEATRRAPKNELVRSKPSGWLARLRDSFVAHPAWAAAATLVMVVGVGSALYVRGARVAEPTQSVTVASSAPPTARAAQVAPAPALADNRMPVAPEVVGAISASKEYNADLAEDRPTNQPAPKRAQTTTAPSKSRPRAAEGAKQKDEQDNNVPLKQAASLRGPDDKDGDVDLGRSESESSLDKMADSAVSANQPVNAISGGGFAQSPNSDSNPSKKSDSVADAKEQKQVTAKPASMPVPSPAAATAAAPHEESIGKPPRPPTDIAQATQTVAWARAEHDKLKKLVAAGKCSEAARVGAGISARAPDYYQQNVASDRQVQACAVDIRQKRSGKEKSSAPVAKPSKKAAEKSSK